MGEITIEQSQQEEANNLEALGLGEWKEFPYEPVEISPVLSINLSEEFRHIFGLLYSIKRSEERSERVLSVINRAVKLNASNPTAWMLRREVVEALAQSGSTSIWKKELAFTASVITKSAKNYQAWEHRRFVAESGNMLQAEIEFTDLVLNEDEKNYHAWSHRQWLVREHGMVEGELAATEWFIRTDIRNNSAWNHRWLVTGVVEGGRSEAELKFALEVVPEAPRNESVWNYIHALGKFGVDLSSAKEKARECLEVDAGCVAARRFLILNGSPSAAKEIKIHCELLAAGVDPIRKKYWQAQGDAASALLEQ